MDCFSISLLKCTIKTKGLKISELKEIKTIRRPSKKFDEKGDRIYQMLEFETKFTKTIKEKGVLRFMAKLIDLIPFVLLFYFVFKIDLSLTLVYSILLVILLGAIFESIWGKTLGKHILGLTVMDDEGKNPDFLKSLKRNSLCVLNFFPAKSDFMDDTAGLYGTRVVFSMNLNNKYSQTYVVDKKENSKIKILLNS